MRCRETRKQGRQGAGKGPNFPQKVTKGRKGHY